MADQPKLVLWAREGCDACQKTKAYLHEHGYNYDSIDVGGRDDLRDILEAKYGIRHVPVLEIGRGQHQYEAITDVDLSTIEARIHAEVNV